MRDLNISEARARLPELARMLVKEPGAVAYIKHRDLDDDLALTTRSHIEGLERTIEALRKQFATPFKLEGSAQTDLSPEELIEMIGDMRRNDAAAFERKLTEMTGE